MAAHPGIAPSAPIQFVINAASGSSDAEATREAIESALREQRRTGELHFCRPAEVPGVARACAAQALQACTALVGVGGDGTLNAVAQAAHAAGCAFGVVPRGTFNYFARTHGIPLDPAEAVGLLLRAVPVPVQVGAINDRIFLVNASLGLYPDLLEDREAYKRRFGRSRWVALWAACVTLLRAQRQWRLRIEQGGAVREVRTLTLFVGNNRLQLEQVGVEPAQAPGGGLASGRITAVTLRPVGTLGLIGLMLRGALGTLGEADSVEHFEFQRLVVRPALPLGRRGVKVAFDGEVTAMRAPLEFRVPSQPLYLLRPAGTAEGAAAAAGGEAPGR